jgi:signal transduction histidine kinase
LISSNHTALEKWLMAARKNQEVREINPLSDRPSTRPDSVPRAYLELSQQLDLPEVARRSLRLVEELTGPTARVSLLSWEDEMGGLTVLAGWEIAPGLRDALRFLRPTRQPAYLDLAQPGSLPAAALALQNLPDTRLTAMAYFPPGQPDRAEQVFQGGWLILSPKPLNAGQREELCQLAELIEPALLNAAAHQQILHRCRKLETIRQDWEKLWSTRDEQEQAQAKEVAHLKDEFISLVSHELRNPMASILGFAELMLTRQLTETKSRLYVETIYQDALRLSSLINDFLDHQRMEVDQTDKLKPDPATFPGPLPAS